MSQLDPLASTFGLHHSMVIPIGARSKESIERYVGRIERVFGKDEGFMVYFEALAPANDLPVWAHHRCGMLAHPKQLWIHIRSRRYRQLYLELFRDQVANGDIVIDHIMNRRLAKALNYDYVRLLHISRNSNSSSGRGGESLAVDFLPTSQSVNPDLNASEIVYADPMDLLKMLDIPVGGFGLETVSDHHHLFYS